MFKDRRTDIDAIKKEIDAYRPLPDYILPMLKEYFRIGLTYSSNALEGNSLTETETKIILEDDLTIGGKTIREHFEVIGHGRAYNFMWDKSQYQGWTEHDILELHRLFYHGIDSENAGSYRKVPIFVTGTDFELPKPDKIPNATGEFCKKIASIEKDFHPVYLAAIAHAELVTIHPFIDGNGRTARLLMNLILMQNGYPITIIPPLMRSSYISTISQANKGNFTPFLQFISEMVYESSKEYIRLLRSAL